MNNEKNTTLAILLVLGLSLIAYSAWVAVSDRNDDAKSDGEPTACTMDAFQCPDGSWVGRTGPACEFICPAATATPATTTTISLVGALGDRLTGLGVTIIPRKIEEDSRCPVDVQCIQAGTVRLTATVVSGLGTSTSVLALDKALTTETETVTLVAVSPTARAGTAISSSDYRFTFKVSKR